MPQSYVNNLMVDLLMTQGLQATLDQLAGAIEAYAETFTSASSQRDMERAAVAVREAFINTVQYGS